MPAVASLAVYRDRGGASVPPVKIVLYTLNTEARTPT
jgi:hypothetical protein